MSSFAALAAGKAITAGDGVYVERADPRELALESRLRAWLARLPRGSADKRRWRALVAEAAANETAMQALDDAALVGRFRLLCAQMRREGFVVQLVGPAFAAVREAARRSLGMRHYDVQLAGGWTLLCGQVAEMQTGEGKTLVATLAACVGAAAGATVHVVTVNDYLSARDAEVNLPLYRFMGLTVGIIGQDMQPHERREQYACDVVYVSNKELVFDYLKDRIAARGLVGSHVKLRELHNPGRAPGLLLRGLQMAIVDEADSVLIDEARTPLIISETVEEADGGRLYHEGIEYARRLAEGEHFTRGRDGTVWLRPPCDAAVATMTAAAGGVWRSPTWRLELIQKALTALHCFHRDRHYIIVEDKVQIVDEFTGRVMPDRSWERGLHQMIEAKEDCEITGQRRTLSRITYQRFFRRYLLLAGMTGTAREVEPELRQVYDLKVTPIPTHKPARRAHLGAVCTASAEERWERVARRAAALADQGRAVLAGTRSVEASEKLSAQLDAMGVAHTVLNARQDKDEAEAVAQAGQRGRITVATNMAGRGTDIKPEPDVLAAGGLHVILTEYHESRRIDRQLFGRSARQGEPGSVEAIVCLDDELFVRHAPGLRAMFRSLIARDRPLGGRLLALLVSAAQANAERANLRQRMDTLRNDRRMQDLMGFTGQPE